MEPQQEQGTPLKEKIDKIISRGVAEQDQRTASLLHGELPTGETVADSAGGEPDMRPKIIRKFDAWRRKNMSDFVFLLWLCVVVGLFSGFAAHIFNRLITIVSHIFLSRIQADKINWWLIFVPVGGIVLSGIYTRYIIHTNLTHGVTRLMHSIYKGNFILKRNLIYSPIIGSTITLGLGGSDGSEGPIAYSGAAIGSNLGRWLGLQPPLIKVLLGAGAAAGISGIFQSPVGGLLFTLEFLKMEIGTLAILGVMLACLISYGVVFLCNGCVVASTFTPDIPLDISQYGAVLAMGFLCGLYSLYYTRVINKTDQWFSRFKNPWLMNICGGLFIGVGLVLFPSLYGVGYPVVSGIIHSHFSDVTAGNVFQGLHMGVWGVMMVAALILAIKCWVCGVCNASGGVSSDFAPTLFAGAIAGLLFSMFCNTVLKTHLPIPAFVLLGMGAVMAGCVEAPLMTIFIVLNMGTEFVFALALILSVYSSYITVRIFSHIRGYDSKMERHLLWFHHSGNKKSLNPSGN